MKIDVFTRVLLVVIAVTLTVIAFRPFFILAPVAADSASFSYLFPQPAGNDQGRKDFIDLRKDAEYERTHRL